MILQHRERRIYEREDYWRTENQMQVNLEQVQTDFKIGNTDQWLLLSKVGP